MNKPLALLDVVGDCEGNAQLPGLANREIPKGQGHLHNISHFRGQGVPLSQQWAELRGWIITLDLVHSMKKAISLD